MKIQELIELLKDEQNLDSYEKAAKFLKISGAALHKIRNGGGIDDSTAIKLAKGINHEPMEVIAIARKEKAKDKTTERFWENIIKHSGTAASITLLFHSVFIYILC